MRKWSKSGQKASRLNLKHPGAIALVEWVAWTIGA